MRPIPSSCRFGILRVRSVSRRSPAVTAGCADGAIIVHDVTDKEPFNSVKNWRWVRSTSVQQFEPTSFSSETSVTWRRRRQCRRASMASTTSMRSATCWTRSRLTSTTLAMTSETPLTGSLCIRLSNQSPAEAEDNKASERVQSVMKATNKLEEPDEPAQDIDASATSAQTAASMARVFTQVAQALKRRRSCRSVKRRTQLRPRALPRSRH